MSERLTPEALDEIRARWPDGERWLTNQARPDLRALLAHIDALQTELQEKKGELADTEQARDMADGSANRTGVLPSSEVLDEKERTFMVFDPKKVVYECVFHKTTGCSGGITTTDIDPCALVLVGDWLHDNQHDGDNWQEFWCHRDCFIKVTGRSADDLELRDELKP